MSFTVVLGTLRLSCPVGHFAKAAAAKLNMNSIPSQKLPHTKSSKKESLLVESGLPKTASLMWTESGVQGLMKRFA